MTRSNNIPDPVASSDRSLRRPADGAQPGPSRLSRRAVIGLGGAAIVGASLGTTARPAAAAPALTRNAADVLRPEIHPRDDWGGDLPVMGDIVTEDDVRFLLVHHTASTNDYGPDQVADQIRGFYRFHTGPEKGWPDVAYNFFVDRYGGLWEARAGSIEGPVRGDATGGSQGFALLCSLIGDHSLAPVTEESLEALVRLLAWLAELHGIDTAPGAEISFSSRGSNRWPAGTEVTARTISGHRDMSQTGCPGDLAYDLLPVTIPSRVSARRLDAAAPDPSTATTDSTTATTDSTTVTTGGSRVGPEVTLVPVDPQTTVSDPTPTGDTASAAPAPTDDGESAIDDRGATDGLGRPTVFLGAAATAVALVAATALRLRRRVGG